jgi:LysM repeat protein
MLRILLAGLALFAACAPVDAGPDPLPSATLRPYSTATPSPTPEHPAGLMDGAAVPTPTPFTYTVAANDTLFGIALRFGVSLEDLMAANPGVSAQALTIGTTLRIPSGPEDISGEPTPTPVPLLVSQFHCYPTASGALWCLALVANEYTDRVENLSALVTLLDRDGEVIASQVALPPLNLLPPGQALPLAAFFPPPVPPDAVPQVQLLTAIRLLPGDARYLPAAAQNVLVAVDWGGRTARVSGRVLLPAGSGPAGQVWVAAVAYDEGGNVVGMRRWEAGEALQPGGSLPFELTVASLAGAIDRVTVVVEARP